MCVSVKIMSCKNIGIYLLFSSPPPPPSLPTYSAIDTRAVAATPPLTPLPLSAPLPLSGLPMAPKSDKPVSEERLTRCALRIDPARLRDSFEVEVVSSSSSYMVRAFSPLSFSNFKSAPASTSKPETSP